MNKKALLIVTVVIIAVLGVYYYFSQESEVKRTGDIKFTHEFGTTYLDKNPERVVVFDYGILDSLDYLGVEVIALPKENLPSYLKKYDSNKYHNAGSLKEPDLEKLRELKPDLIIISSRQQSFYQALSKIAPTLYLPINNQDYFGSFTINMQLLGEIFDKTAQIEAKLLEIEAKITEIHTFTTTNNLSGLIILVEGRSLSAYGNNSRFGIIHKEFGINPVDEKIEVSTHGQNIGLPYLQEHVADYLFVIDKSSVVSGTITESDILDNIIVKSNYEPHEIIYLDPEVWYISIGGIISTLKMVEEVKLNVIK